MEFEYLIQAYERNGQRMYLYRVAFRDVDESGWEYMNEYWTFRKDDETEFHFANAELAVMFAEQNQWKVVDL